jgi:hypothetical protein
VQGNEQVANTQLASVNFYQTTLRHVPEDSTVQKSHNFRALPNIIRVAEARRKTRDENVARMGGMRSAQSKNVKRRNHLQNLALLGNNI